MSLLDELNGHAQSGFAGILGLIITSVDEDSKTLTARWDITERVRNSEDQIHDGAVSSVAETVASFAASLTAPDGVTVVGVSNSMQFIDPTDRGQFTVIAEAVGSWDVNSPVWRIVITSDTFGTMAEGTVRLQRITDKSATRRGGAQGRGTR